MPVKAAISSSGGGIADAHLAEAQHIGLQRSTNSAGLHGGLALRCRHCRRFAEIGGTRRDLAVSRPSRWPKS
jgi:hypothetical protein